MNILHLFSGFNTLTTVAHALGHEVVSVDIKKYNTHLPPVHLCNVLDFEYKKYCCTHFDLLIIGFPCNVFSKVGRFQHFSTNWKPLSLEAKNINTLLDCIFDIISYFSKAIFIIENPHGALKNYPYFLPKFSSKLTQIVSVSQFSYGHTTQKKTHLFTNSDRLILTPVTYRCNGKNLYPNISNLTYFKKTSYPDAFCRFLITEFV